MMAQKKAVGSTNNGRDSHSKRLGIKVFGGANVIPGNIIVRQRGTNFNPGQGTAMGRDHTIYSIKNGQVFFTRKKHRSIVCVLQKMN